MVTPTRRERVSSFAANVRADWREVGGFGRFAWLGIAGSLVVAVVLGFSITGGAERHLLEGRVEMLEALVSDLNDRDATPSPAVGGDRTVFDEAVRLRLLGGETIQVKLWASDGTIVYSDDAHTEGQRFELSPLAASAFAGEAASARIETDDPAHAHHRDLGRLIEVYLPFEQDASGTVLSVFEIEQQVDRLDAALAAIRRNVWLSISSGIAALAVFLGLLMLGRARVVQRRRRQIESLLGALVRAQEEERRRIVGALHDDVGQPLYALMYGLEGSKRSLDPAEPVVTELDRLGNIVRDIDATLRAELRTIHEGSIADAGLVVAIEDLAAVTKRESDLDVITDLAIDVEPSPLQRAVLFRAIREGVTNARRHASATVLTIRLSTTRTRVVAEVLDDGLGGPIDSGLGLTTTRERLEAIGGTLDVHPRSGHGTVFRATVPIDGDRP